MNHKLETLHLSRYNARVNDMLTTYKQPQFIEKILTDSFGRQYRVLFAVSFIDGEIRGRVVSATQIERSLKLVAGSQENRTNFCLPCAKSSQLLPSSSKLPAASSIVSPYIELYFFNSQPTRAPSK